MLAAFSNSFFALASFLLYVGPVDSLSKLQPRSRAEDESFCDASVTKVFMHNFTQQFHREPKVALIVGEELRFPARHNERIDRWAKAMKGADVFVAVDSGSADKIRFLPKPTRAATFDHTYDESLMAPEYANFPRAAFHQLLRTGDALKLLNEQEAEQGWKYDVVARLRTETVQRDMCTKGPDHGCYASGAFQKAMAAKCLSKDGEGKIYKGHDRAYWGRRDDMQVLFENIETYLAEKGGLHFKRRQLQTTSEYPSYELQASLQSPMSLYQQRRLTDLLQESNFPGEETLGVVTDSISFVSVPLPEVEIRRFGCDYSAAEGVTDRPDFHPENYAIGCTPFPQVSDATAHKCMQ